MHDVAATLANLLVVFVAAKVAGEVFERLRQPAVIGELLVGVALGSHALGWVSIDAGFEVLATLGVTVLMFFVGLDTHPRELLKVGRQALIVGSAGVVLPLGLGYYFGRLNGWPEAESLFVGATLVATSVGITARVLADRGLISMRLSRIVLAAAVIDDVLGLLVLSVVSGVARGPLDYAALALVALKAVGFLAAMVLVAPWLVVRSEELLERLHLSNAPFATSLAAMLGFAALSESIGLAGIVGAFFAGMAFAAGPERWELRSRTEPLYEWLAPYFFVLTGSRVDVKLFLAPEVLLPGIVLVVIAVATKIVGCGVGVLGEGPRAALAVGVGMVPRGEVGLIVAAAGQRLGIVSAPVYAMVVFVIVVSTVVVPPVLPALFRAAQPPSKKEPAPVE